MGDVVLACVALSVNKLMTFEAGSKSGVDVEDLHLFQAATRRLQSDLGIFHSIIDPLWATDLRNELKWLGTEVGAVRDFDVLQARLVDRLRLLSAPDDSKANRLLARLHTERSAARLHVLDVLGCMRYRALANNLHDAATHPALATEAGLAIEERAARLLPYLVNKPWKKLRAAARRIASESSEGDVHAVRILAKR